jgi:hypothetical protein
MDGEKKNSKSGKKGVEKKKLFSMVLGGIDL